MEELFDSLLLPKNRVVPEVFVNKLGDLMKKNFFEFAVDFLKEKEKSPESKTPFRVRDTITY